MLLPFCRLSKFKIKLLCSISRIICVLNFCWINNKGKKTQNFSLTYLAGRRAASYIEDKYDADNRQKPAEMLNFNASEPVVILGFGQMGQVLANFLSNPLASGGDSDAVGWPYVAFDLDRTVVKWEEEDYGSCSKAAIDFSCSNNLLSKPENSWCILYKELFKENNRRIHNTIFYDIHLILFDYKFVSF
ncbi:uncharacterized protein LOC133287636 [Gastrolobium bilobum]|uniref:uncharacterized protein LOC133287636 n=1 Tax=Gastrolobium bilobum TaxID=150636 RepID=UPI002AB229BC|nr:uncharacterized protein LOC133287636 [Gastrolobium bilobum]XP_061341268.1 uncharacterized protein LOC133287636 [Gastrolobium bilobum]